MRADLAHLRRFRSWRVMAVNNTWELVPWAHSLYACDLQWWDHYRPTFAGRRWTASEVAATRHGAELVRKSSGTGLCMKPMTVNTGGNSGYQAVNLAYHLGARRIVLLGYDMHRQAGGHWHGEHEGMLSAPQTHLEAWARNFGALARDLKAAGVSVVNATPGSALRCFPMATMAEAMQ